MSLYEVATNIYQLRLITELQTKRILQKEWTQLIEAGKIDLLNVESSQGE